VWEECWGFFIVKAGGKYSDQFRELKYLILAWERDMWQIAFPQVNFLITHDKNTPYIQKYKDLRF
jgi:hypothetical protein